MVLERICRKENHNTQRQIGIGGRLMSHQVSVFLGGVGKTGGWVSRWMKFIIFGFPY